MKQDRMRNRRVKEGRVKGKEERREGKTEYQGSRELTQGHPMKFTTGTTMLDTGAGIASLVMRVVKD
jgi:hypothetical protein